MSVEPTAAPTSDAGSTTVPAIGIAGAAAALALMVGTIGQGLVAGARADAAADLAAIAVVQVQEERTAVRLRRRWRRATGRRSPNASHALTWGQRP